MNTSSHTYNKDFDQRLFGRDATGAARSQGAPADATATRTQPAQQEQAAKPKAKDPPEFRITEVSIIVPSDGLKKDLPFEITGKIQPLIGTLTRKKVRLRLIALYKGTEDQIGITEADIDTRTNSFTGTCKQLFYHNEYVKDREKPADAKFTLEARANGTGAEKEAISKPVELPMATAAIILKKGRYDDTWVKGHEATHPKSGKEYVPDNKVKKLQENMANFRFFKYTERKERITGFFDDATHKAVWEFQECARKLDRKKGTDTRIIKADKITLNDPPDGEVGPNTEKEIALWLQNNWVKPDPEFRKEDVDDNGVRNRHGDRGGEKHHPGTLLTEFQKTLKDIAAYSGKIDGWFFNNLEKALSIFHDHAARGEFVDAKGKKVILEDKDRLKDYRKGVITGDTIKVAEKVKEIGLKVAENDDNSKLNKKYAKIMEGLVGKPYVLNANGPDTFDCSGAACWSLRKTANPNFGDYTANDLFQKFTIPSDSNQPGTVKFYDYTSDGKIDHVTTIIDNAQMVHPSSGAGVIEARPLNYLDSYTKEKGGKIYTMTWNWDAIKR